MLLLSRAGLLLKSKPYPTLHMAGGLSMQAERYPKHVQIKTRTLPLGVPTKDGKRAIPKEQAHQALAQLHHICTPLRQLSALCGHRQPLRTIISRLLTVQSSKNSSLASVYAQPSSASRAQVLLIGTVLFLRERSTILMGGRRLRIQGVTTVRFWICKPLQTSIYI
jgi:hypothetical protein